MFANCKGVSSLIATICMPDVEANGGGLSQRPPRSRRRQASLPEVGHETPERPAKRAADNAVDTASIHHEPYGDVATADAAQTAATAAAEPVPMLHISDKHTSAALRSAKVEGYNFECKASIHAVNWMICSKAKCGFTCS